MNDDHSASRGKRLAWFILLWGGGVLALTVVGSIIKLALK